VAKIDLSSMSKSDLEKLKGDVEKTLASLEQRRKADAKKAAEEAAKKFGFSLGDLVGREKAKRGGAPAKYRNPADPSQTWSGRGRQPGWIKDGLAKGKKLAEFAI
jgi:DNA-binding protein H-NS